jgi:hypothetical protein
MNLEVFRGLSELELLKLLEQLQEQVPAPVLSSTSSVLEEVRYGTSFQTSSVTEIGNTIRLETTPPPDFQPRLMLHQEPISGFSPAGDTENDAISSLFPAGDTRNDGVAATSSPRGTLLVPPSLFSKSKETGSHPHIPLPVRRPDTGCGIPATPL